MKSSLKGVKIPDKKYKELIDIIKSRNLNDLETYLVREKDLSYYKNFIYGVENSNLVNEYPLELTLKNDNTSLSMFSKLLEYNLPFDIFIIKTLGVMVDLKLSEHFKLVLDNYPHIFLNPLPRDKYRHHINEEDFYPINTLLYLKDINNLSILKSKELNFLLSSAQSPYREKRVAENVFINAAYHCNRGVIDADILDSIIYNSQINLEKIAFSHNEQFLYIINLCPLSTLNYLIDNMGQSFYLIKDKMGNNPLMSIANYMNGNNEDYFIFRYLEKSDFHKKISIILDKCENKNKLISEYNNKNENFVDKFINNNLFLIEDFLKNQVLNKEIFKNLMVNRFNKDTFSHMLLKNNKYSVDYKIQTIDLLNLDITYNKNLNNLTPYEVFIAKESKSFEEKEEEKKKIHTYAEKQIIYNNISYTTNIKNKIVKKRI